ncbi:MAG: hypothetical protein P4L92_22395 [Rudaea sp.]|nr:hypothetical protein [Rudaea sp.]
MRMILLISLLLASSAVAAQYTVLLNFPDKSIQVCASTGFLLSYLTMDVNVTECKADEIFADGMGG